MISNEFDQCAPRVKMPTAQADPMKARAEPERLIQPRCAAQATTAGAVMDRNPATTPIPKASNNASPEFMKPLQRDGRLARDLAFNLKSAPHGFQILRAGNLYVMPETPVSYGWRTFRLERDL